MQAQGLIHALGLSPHPEGGWYRETWRGAIGAGNRSSGTAILFLLEAGQRSHWHRVDATEIWFWQNGAPLILRQAVADAGPVTEQLLGPDIESGATLQGIVPADAWQSAESTGDWTLVSCVVVPGFEFDGFTLAAGGWKPGDQ